MAADPSPRPGVCLVQNPFLIGAKVYLRPVELADAPQFVRWLNDVEVRSNLQIHLPLNQLQEEAYIERVGDDERKIMFGIAAREPDQLIGVTGLDTIDWKDRHARFGISLGDKTQWGKGYGTEATRLITDYAFDVLNLHRVWLHVYEFNERGRGAYARVGFVQEGVLRQAHYHDGRYWDMIAMGLLRADRATDETRMKHG